ncbi:MAG TPA: EVE domain-containing protein [Gemmataceae bacterium]|nr:EVE domain-containing protein [Gemmataceae bacterium]
MGSYSAGKGQDGEVDGAVGGMEASMAKESGAWLFKEEPEHYSFADLQRDGGTLWTGVTNNLALQNLRKVKKGDRVLYYHTGKEKAVVGEMRVVSDPVPDPEDGSSRRVAVRVEPVRRLLAPVTLAQIKEDPDLADWELVRLPRLSVVPVNRVQWDRVEELSRGQA